VLRRTTGWRSAAAAAAPRRLSYAPRLPRPRNAPEAAVSCSALILIESSPCAYPLRVGCTQGKTTRDHRAGGGPIRFYTRQHRHTCGVDLHARTMYVCVLDAGGEVVLHQNLPATPEAFLQTLAPFRDDLVVACECIFTWYWLADLCAREGIAFVLGHALFMKAIHGGKAKNDLAPVWWTPQIARKCGRSVSWPSDSVDSFRMSTRLR